MNNRLFNMHVTKRSSEKKLGGCCGLKLTSVLLRGYTLLFFTPEFVSEGELAMAEIPK